jgi:hypothetical protein
MLKLKTMAPFKMSVKLTRGGITTSLGDTETANYNRLQVIQGALTIEKYLKLIISYHFFGQLGAEAGEFENRILDADWCSYGNKCKLTKDILLATGLLQGKELNDFDQCIRKVGNWRNAFAHGTFEVEGEKVFLCYYKDERKKDELSDMLLAKIQSVFSTAYTSITAIHNKQQGVSQDTDHLIV